MLLDLDKFYNSNYKDFVHKEALEEALKQVPEVFLKDIDAKAILSITFSVDDVGENPIYVTYLDSVNQEHIVKLRPDITAQLTEVLKRYPTKTEMQEALEDLRANITDDYTILINQEVETLNSTINNVNSSLTQQIADTLDTSKRYTDEKHQEALETAEAGDARTLETARHYTDSKAEMTQIALKNYTDAKHGEALTKISEGDTNTLNSATEYTDNLKDELVPKIESNKNRLYIKNHDGESKEIESSGRVTFEVNDGIKAIEVKQNDTEELPSERIDFSNLDGGAKVIVNDETEPPNNSILALRWPEVRSGRASYAGMLKNLAVTDKDGQSVILDMEYYAQKSDIPTNTVTTDYLTEQLTNYYTKTESDGKYALKGELPSDVVSQTELQEELLNYATTSELSNYETTAQASEDHDKLSEVPTGKKQPYINWYKDIDSNYIRLVLDGEDIRAHINKSDEGGERIGYLSARNPSTFATSDDVTSAVATLPTFSDLADYQTHYEASQERVYLNNDFLRTVFYDHSKHVTPTDKGASYFQVEPYNGTNETFTASTIRYYDTTPSPSDTLNMVRNVDIKRADDNNYIEGKLRYTDTLNYERTFYLPQFQAVRPSQLEQTKQDLISLINESGGSGTTTNITPQLKYNGNAISIVSNYSTLTITDAFEVLSLNFYMRPTITPTSSESNAQFSISIPDKPASFTSQDSIPVFGKYATNAGTMTTVGYYRPGNSYFVVPVPGISGTTTLKETEIKVIGTLIHKK